MSLLNLLHFSKARVRREPGLIFDLGANGGEDTTYYLAKGFRVLCVEADPILSERIRVTHASSIEAGRLTVLNCGVWTSSGVMPFYRNLANSHWSSFDPSYGCRAGTPFEIENVPCRSFESLIAEFGVPYYAKVDIEGADRTVTAALKHLPERPRFISVEEYGPATIDDLHAAGYRKFHLAPQNLKRPPQAPATTTEGRAVSMNFNGLMSGVFGRDIRGWSGYRLFKWHFARQMRSSAKRSPPRPEEWYDIHATW